MRWLHDPSFVDAAGERIDDFPLRLKYAERFTKIMTMPNYEQMIAVTGQYVRSCIPAYVRGEKDFWEVTGRPGGKWAVLRINMNWQINYDVFTDWKGGFTYRWFLWREQLSTIFGGSSDHDPSGLLPFSIYVDEAPPEPQEFRLQSGDAIICDWRPSPLVKGGADQVVLRVTDPDQALMLLNDPNMIRAARIFALNLARMGKTPFNRYHCFDLADQFVEHE